jgi:hypothetical protein
VAVLNLLLLISNKSTTKRNRMPYSAQPNRANPTCFVFLIDQSGSMDDMIGITHNTNESRKKSEAVAYVTNLLLQNLIAECVDKGDGETIKDYFHIAVIGYGKTVSSAFSGGLKKNELAPISIVDKGSEIKPHPGSESACYPVWFDAKGIADGGTPMCEALGEAKRLVKNWLVNHPNCFPPIVINITDGEATDGDPAAAADEVRKLKSSDGAVLLFNIHLSALTAAPVLYPSSEHGLPDQFAKQLFRMSSVLPEHMMNIARTIGIHVGAGSRGFVFNADMAALTQFVTFGTRTTPVVSSQVNAISPRLLS